MGRSQNSKSAIKKTLEKAQPYPLALMGVSLPPPHIENPLKQRQLKNRQQQQQQEPDKSLKNDKHDEESDTDSVVSDKGYVNGPLDPIFGQHRAFPINIDISDLDESRPPADVNSYLARVRMEAEKMDVVAFVPREDSPANVIADPQEERLTEAQEEALRWHVEFMEGFVQRRSQFEEMVRTNETLVFDFPKTMKTWRTFMFNNDPSDEYALALDTVTILKLINYSTKWLSKSINAHFANWVILLLVIVPDVLEANDISTLRTFAKKALRQRADELNEHEEVMRSIISAVGDFFGQRDLLEGYVVENR
ncbi:unnamed protein product [Kuraishia capsulata CBS 1993]|uniref:Survival motor neuron interacting protein 1 n=1 Tax=Kuraishia capsulata CBS 1993 TaxID=1382522 RepID=W6MUC9_9ASCO|nr:uncharacterized protein KUCA_T00001515001 [Kuraishia capsulata CBS 1993]CDK25545.1 unnamed protein product [Kuraishia capsulata CBS 1993]